ncbi:myeloid/lymphoid or mixed-lineage leukemia (trithorax homolog, Drosophila); translocated to, 11, isoform CRA_a [Rattus norvegicus]|uniref:Myeloid/lymphoid or mixed-lineage leukemia (Trithorax homolog, Drosophila); translocated to, 11, isoform CRA_a n=1 Tax=Rattus norvegicus TaxID=10116 RepID=A6K2X1_RAT|nr:myeloid/lymphoid or mixed-lineage leukemia (trithorax homolog, Drosophila); translocated to, 11, isoform CRA_a [Rattus norvegicus]EDL85729.1 myeloid/lymphoid or mixed-lineage leukemia (trithorax homolog, Drosophila); translocated to, 11, isoform CRA_a [Rattus norvegicus]
MFVCMYLFIYLLFIYLFIYLFICQLRFSQKPSRHKVKGLINGVQDHRTPPPPALRILTNPRKITLLQGFREKYSCAKWETSFFSCFVVVTF